MVKQRYRFFIALALVLILSAGNLSAQNFLSCSHSPLTDAHHSERLISTQGEISRLVHVLAGDDHQAFLGSTLQVSELDSAQINAFSVAPNRIFLTTGLLEFITSSSELGFVLAHEMAHLRSERQSLKMFLSGGTSTAQSQDPLIVEINADLEASMFLFDSPLDRAAGIKFLKRIKELRSRSQIEPAFLSGLERRIKALENSNITVLPN